MSFLFPFAGLSCHNVYQLRSAVTAFRDSIHGDSQIKLMTINAPYMFLYIGLLYYIDVINVCNVYKKIMNAFVIFVNQCSNGNKRRTGTFCLRTP